MSRNVIQRLIRHKRPASRDRRSWLSCVRYGKPGIRARAGVCQGVAGRRSRCDANISSRVSYAGAQSRMRVGRAAALRTAASASRGPSPASGRRDMPHGVLACDVSRNRCAPRDASRLRLSIHVEHDGGSTTSGARRAPPHARAILTSIPSEGKRDRIGTRTERQPGVSARLSCDTAAAHRGHLWSDTRVAPPVRIIAREPSREHHSLPPALPGQSR